MPFAIEEFRDLVRLLEERPEWRTELRRLVLTDELLALPEQVARLRQDTEQRFQELTARVTELAEAQARTEGRVSRLEEAMTRLTEAQARTEERVGRLEEAVTRLTEAQARTEERVGRLEEAVTRLTEAQARTEAQLAELTRVVHTLADDVGELKGKGLEADYRIKGPAYFSSMIRRVHVLSADELSTLIEEAVDRGMLSYAQAREIYQADLVVRGKRLEDGSEVHLVVEVSWGLGPEDVERAVHRAELLAHTGVTAIPVIAGKRVTADAAQLARTEKVWQLTDGRVVPPELASENP